MNNFYGNISIYMSIFDLTRSSFYLFVLNKLTFPYDLIKYIRKFPFLKHYSYKNKIVLCYYYIRIKEKLFCSKLRLFS